MQIMIRYLMTFCGIFGKSDGWHILKSALKGGTDGCGILEIGGCIETIIDAGKDIVRLSFHDIQNTDADAVGRSSVAGIGMHALNRKILLPRFKRVAECDAV